MQNEGPYKTKLIKKIKKALPGAMVLKNDADYQQGIPDLSIFYENRWGMLEVKRSADETPEPNQPYFVDLANSMSFGAFIYPENEEEVIDALKQALRP